MSRFIRHQFLPLSRDYPDRPDNPAKPTLNRSDKPKMNRLKIYVSSLGAVFLLVIVAAGVLGSIAYDWLKATIEALPCRSQAMPKDVSKLRTAQSLSDADRR